MHHKIVCIVMFFLFLSCQRNVHTPVVEHDDEFDLFVEEFLNENQLPGLIAAVIDDDSILKLAAAGVREYGEDTPITPHDLIHIGSCTKAMTSYVLQQLIDEDVLSWESTLLDVYPEWKDSIHNDYHETTLHQYVTHTSGSPANAPYHFANHRLKMIYRRGDLIKKNLKESAPHNSYTYSNLGYIIAGHMAETKTNKTWEALIEQYLFNPLEMKTFGFGPPGVKDTLIQPRGHTVSSTDIWTPQFFDNLPVLGPAGTVHLTISDWSKFIQHMFLKENALTKHKFLLTPKEADYACGWVLAKPSWANGQTYWHNGSNNTWYTLVWTTPETNRAYLVSTNSFSPSSPQILEELVVKMATDFSK